MSSRSLPSLHRALWLALVGVSVLVGREAQAQFINSAPAGVLIDANGVLSTRVVADPGFLLARQKRDAAMAALHADIAKPSELRKISLVRLERAVAAKLAAGETPTDEMRFLAGLTRITHVFFLPESNDIVIAGPAEGYMLDPTGRAIGVHTGHAVLELQDLIVALRAYSPSGNRARVIGCSIDPTQEGLARLQQTLSQIGGHATPDMTEKLTLTLRNALGKQIVSVKGVPAETHFAQVLVEADYRMKLIGIGLERPFKAKITSYVSAANPRSVARNAMQRWYFTPHYDFVRVTADGQAMRMEGEGVHLVGEHELVSGAGERAASDKGDRASQQFCESFTRNYGELAKESPVYAQLRSLIDLSVAAAFIQQQDFYSLAGWELGVFADEAALPVQTYTAPKMVESAINAIWKGRTLMTPIGGGVNIQPTMALDEEHKLTDDEGVVDAARKQVVVPGADRWWWD